MQNSRNSFLFNLLQNQSVYFSVNTDPLFRAKNAPKRVLTGTLEPKIDTFCCAYGALRIPVYRS